MHIELILFQDTACRRLSNCQWNMPEYFIIRKLIWWRYWMTSH